MEQDDVGREPEVDPRIFGRPIRDPRHELYCQLRALDGVAARRAYAQAILGDATRSPAARSVTALESRADIRDRIEQLQTAMARSRVAKTYLTQSYIVEALVEIADRTMGYSRLVIRGDQQVCVHKHDVTGEDQIVGVFAFDPDAALKALNALAKMHGWHEAPPTAPDAGSRDLAALRASLEAKMQQLDALEKKSAKQKADAG